MTPKLGQKLTDKPKDFLLQVRLDAESKKELDEAVKALNSNRSDVVRKGIKMVKKSLKK